MAGGFGDPALRVETWLFVEVGQQPKRQPIYRCLPYVLVNYDNDPQQYLEPSPPDEQYALIGPADVSANGALSHKRINPAVDGLGRVGFFRFVTKRPFETFAYDDVDAATNIGQLANLDARGQIVSATA